MIRVGAGMSRPVEVLLAVAEAAKLTAELPTYTARMVVNHVKAVQRCLAAGEYRLALVYLGHISQALTDTTLTETTLIARVADVEKAIERYGH